MKHQKFKGIDEKTAESIRKLWNETIAREKAEREKVRSEQYIDWVYDYIPKVGSVNSESVFYAEHDSDRDNSLLISEFMSYVEKLAEQQRVLTVSDKSCQFGNEEVAFKIKDKYFNLFRMCGQGTWTCLSVLKEKPEYCYVKVSE